MLDDALPIMDGLSSNPRFTGDTRTGFQDISSLSSTAVPCTTSDAGCTRYQDGLTVVPSTSRRDPLPGRAVAHAPIPEDAGRHPEGMLRSHCCVIMPVQLSVYSLTDTIPYVSDD